MTAIATGHASGDGVATDVAPRAPGVAVDGVPLADPAPAPIGGKRVTRGGSCRSVADFCRASHRGKSPSGFRDPGLGFRLVRP